MAPRKNNIKISEKLSYNPKDKTLYENGDYLKSLTDLESRTLEFLIVNAGIVCSNEKILDNVWNVNAEQTKGEAALVRGVISSLRKAHPDLKKLIQTRTAIGYCLMITGANQASLQSIEISAPSVPINKIWKDTDVICCVYPDMLGVAKLKESNDGFALDFNFEGNEYPEFVSVVYNFYDELNLSKYYNENDQIKLHFMIEDTEDAIEKIQIEFQVEGNRIIGKPYVIDTKGTLIQVDMPISEYAKYKKDLSRIFNVCFVINKAYFSKSKGKIRVRQLSIM